MHIFQGGWVREAVTYTAALRDQLRLLVTVVIGDARCDVHRGCLQTVWDGSHSCIGPKTCGMGSAPSDFHTRSIKGPDDVGPKSGAGGAHNFGLQRAWSWRD